MKPYKTTAVEDPDSNNGKHQINTMDILNKTIKKLSDTEYQDLLMQVSGKKKNKPFMVLETTRNRDVEDSEMMDLLQVNASDYYSLKSRLTTAMASHTFLSLQSNLVNLIPSLPQSGILH